MGDKDCKKRIKELERKIADIENRIIHLEQLSFISIFGKGRITLNEFARIASKEINELKQLIKKDRLKESVEEEKKL